MIRQWANEWRRFRTCQPLDTRRPPPDPVPTRASGRLVTWPFDIEKNDESGYITYTFTVRDLPTGEYSFSPSSSNDGYCFGVDPSAPGQ